MMTNKTFGEVFPYIDMHGEINNRLQRFVFKRPSTGRYIHDFNIVDDVQG